MSLFSLVFSLFLVATTSIVSADWRQPHADSRHATTSPDLRQPPPALIGATASPDWRHGPAPIGATGGSLAPFVAVTADSNVMGNNFGVS